MSVELALKIIKRKVQDPSYSDQDILDLMNVVVGEIATDIRLPGLTTHADLVFSPGLVTIPVPYDYFAHPFKAYNVTPGLRGKVRVWRHFSEFLDMFTDLSANGTVQHLCVDGNKVFVQYVPRVETTIRFWYTSIPEVIRNTKARLTCLPKTLIVPLLVNGVCAEIFSEMEDEEGASYASTAKFFQKFGLAVHRLRSIVQDDGNPEYVVPDGFPDDHEEDRI